MRIIAGKHRGLVLKEFEAENIRPTGDRVKESIFNIIQNKVQDSVVLDLFAGTGNLGLEALSRGAKKVYSCDNNENSNKVIKNNYAKCKQELNLIVKDYKACLKQLLDMQFNLIFLDPPFNTNYAEKAIKLIDENNMLSENGVLVWERSNGQPFSVALTGLELYDSRTYGTVQVFFLRRKA